MTPTDPLPQPPAEEMRTRYRITLIQQLGYGGFSTVWRAHSPEYPGYQLAVKFLYYQSYGNRPTLIKDSLGEFEAADELRRAYIVPIERYLDLSTIAGNTDYPVALVMRCHTPSLAKLLADLGTGDRRLPPSLAAEFGRNLMDALKAIHDRGMVHRDVKPSNVLIELPKGENYYGPEDLPEDRPECAWHALLSDFGTAARADREPAFFMLQDGWKAPELFLDPHSPSPKPNSDHLPHPAEDMYALGLVLEELAKFVGGDPGWLMRVAADLKHVAAAERPLAGSPQLRERLAPDWEERQVMADGGWNPDAHRGFTGRDFVFAAFDNWARVSGKLTREAPLGRGGYFVVEANAGVGKTALATAWVRRGGLHPAYFFRHHEGRTRAAGMAAGLFRALCRRYQINRDAPVLDEEFVGQWAALLREIAARLDRVHPLLLLVDGLDEADNPEKAVELLPRNLPPGLFVVITSRPRIGDRDHLAPLRSHPAACFLEIQGDSEANIDDLAVFLRDQLATRIEPGQERALAHALGGTFQLAVYVVEGIQAGEMTVDQALEAADKLANLPVSEKVFAWYRQTWERIKSQVPDRRDQGELVDFLSLLAAAQTALGEKTQILKILNWRLSDLDWAKRMVRWLIQGRDREGDGDPETLLQLRHKSVYDFLLSKPYDGPARYDLEKTHARIGRHYLAAAETNGWSTVDAYGRAFTLRHLCLSGDPDLLEKAADLLENLDFLQATLTRPPEK